MDLASARATSALSSRILALLWLSAGCASGSASVPSEAPSGEQTAGAEHVHVEDTEGSLDLRAAELTAYERAKPIFDRYCARCHTSEGARHGEDPEPF